MGHMGRAADGPFLRMLLLGMLALAPFPLPRAEAAPAVPEPLVLPNGLTAFLRPITGAKDVSLVVVFRLGGDHDPVGKSGLTHLLEHCYVTAAAGGTAARTYDEVRARYPKFHNAQTADRHTIVAQSFPADRLGDELKDTADRMSTLNVTAEDLAREKPRMLLGAGNMFEKKPDLAARNRARERVLPNRAGGRRGGLPAHIEALTLEDARGFADRYYRPGNAVLALVGAVEVESARRQIRALFADLPKGSPPPECPPAPEPAGGRLDDVETPKSIYGGESTACVAFAAPLPTSPDYVPFLVVTARLIKGPAARAAKAPTAFFAPLDEPGALYLSAPLAAGQKTEDAVAALHAWVAQVVARPMGPSDVPLTASQYGLVLGLDASQEFSLAGFPTPLALRLAAGHVLNLDSAAITKGLDRLKGPDLATAAVRLFDPLKAGAAVVRVKP